MRQIDLIISNQCNIECSHCFQSARLNGYQIQDKEIQTIDNLLQNNGFDVQLLAGEYFLNGNAKRFLRKDQNYLITNGLNIDLDIIRRLDHIVFSLHGFRNNHEILTRRPGSWDATLSNIQRSLRVNPNIEINHVTHSMNYKDIPLFCDFINSLNIKKVNFPLIQYAGRARSMSSEFQLFEDQFREYVLIIDEQRNRFDKNDLYISFSRGAGIGPDVNKKSFNAIRNGDLILNSFQAKNCGIYCPALAENYMVAIRKDNWEWNLYPCFMMISDEFNIGKILIKEKKIIEFEKPFLDRLNNLEGRCSPCDYNEVCKGGCMGSAINNSLLKKGNVNYNAEQPYCLTNARKSIF